MRSDAGELQAELGDAILRVGHDKAHNIREEWPDMILTNEQCDEFRRLPLSFRDMVRAIYEAGMESAARICEREAVMFDIHGAHATATHCAEQIRKAVKEKRDASK